MSEQTIEPAEMNPDPASAGAPTENPARARLSDSERQAEGFRVYLELGPDRRYAGVAKRLGVSIRTVRRWAASCDWRSRIVAMASEESQGYAEASRESALDAAVRATAFRERQYVVAESLLNVAERFLEHVDGDDVDRMSFADACKAYQVASRLGSDVAKAVDESARAGSDFKQQFTELIDRIYAPAEAQKAGSSLQAG